MLTLADLAAAWLVLYKNWEKLPICWSEVARVCVLGPVHTLRGRQVGRGAATFCMAVSYTGGAFFHFFIFSMFSLAFIFLIIFY